MDVLGLEYQQGREISFLPNRPDQFWDSLNLRFAGYWGSLLGGFKRPGCQVDHSLPSSADVKNDWGCISTPPHV